jgi:SulP family sulfate permease
MGFLNLFIHPRGLGDLGPEDVLQLRSSGARLVDVRTTAEFRQGHIEGAISAPLGTTSQAVKEWPRDAKLVLICQSGHRSQAAAHDLLRLGFSDLGHLKGGMAAWARHGAPQVR